MFAYSLLECIKQMFARVYPLKKYILSLPCVLGVSFSFMLLLLFFRIRCYFCVSFNEKDLFFSAICSSLSDFSLGSGSSRIEIVAILL